MSKFCCSKCSLWKDEDQFHSNGVGRRRAACRKCEAARDAFRKGYAAPAGPTKREPKVEPKLPQPQAPHELLREHKREMELRSLKEERRRLVEHLDLAERRNEITNRLGKFTPSLVKAIKRRETASGLREATAVVMCSDWHIEEPVDLEKTNGMNQYDLSVAEKRIKKLTDGYLWLLDMHRSKFAIRDMVLWLGGDLLTGYIHEELEESNQLSPVESVLWLQQHIVAMIDTTLALSNLEKLYVPCSYGNHGRSSKKKRISTGAENSYEWMMYQQLKQWYSDEPRVEILAPKSQLIYLPVYDYTVRFAHGDQVGYGGGVGGLTIPVNKKIANWDVGRRADITCIGHFHQYLSLPYLVTNGSLIGFNPFAIAIGAKYEPPQQAFFLIDSRRGKTASYPIWVEDRPEKLAHDKKSSTRR